MYLHRMLIYLYKVEDRMAGGPYAVRNRGPDDRGKDRNEIGQLRGVALRDESRPVGHLSLGGEPIQDFPVEAVHSEPDHRTGCPFGPARTARDIRVFDRR